MKDKNPLLSVVNGKMCINDRVFEITELRESKEYLQILGAEEALFHPVDDDELDELHDIILRMRKESPYVADDEMTSVFLN